MTTCAGCLIGMHAFCEQETCSCVTCHPQAVDTSEQNDPAGFQESENEDGPDDTDGKPKDRTYARRKEQLGEIKERRKRRQKDDSKLKDPLSTGRKRAAKMYPLDREAPCEWLGKTNVGGGKHPINGCPSADACTQFTRHHGPNKDTTDNSPGNVHRIGHKCHNRWHSANDADYDPDNIILEQIEDKRAEETIGGEP